MARVVEPLIRLTRPDEPESDPEHGGLPMKTRDERHRLDVALFRYGLIAQIMKLPPGSVRAAAVRAMAQRAHVIPGTTRTRVAEGTLLDWIRQYKRDGFEGLKPKERSDRAQPRRMSPDAIETLLSIKKGAPDLSVRQVIKRARETGDIPEEMPLPPSTLHRLFAREGLMVQQAHSTSKDLRRFAYRFPGELWQADVMHGPRVANEKGHKRKVYLIAILDDATRVIPYAHFAFAENAAAFLRVLREAIARRGLPSRVYVEYVACHIFDNLFPVRLCSQLPVTR